MPQYAIIGDIDFLKMITYGHASAYKIHAYLEKLAEVDENQPIISYSNIAERLLRLARDGLIEETVIEGKRSVHGRKDYKITSKGIHALMPDTEIISMLDLKALVGYLSKDKTAEGDKQLLILYYYLISGFRDMQFLLQHYAKYIDRPKLMPLKYALDKDLPAIELKEVKKLSKYYKPILEIVKRRTYHFGGE
jgi:hypothetical protein